MVDRRNKARENRRNTFRRTTQPQDPHNRLVGLFVVFVLISAGLVAVLVDIQTVRDDKLRGIGEDQRFRTKQLDGYRGQVLDRNGTVLAASTPSSNVVADPKQIEDVESVATILSPILGIDAETLTEKLQPENENSRYVRLARNVGDEAADDIQALRSEGSSIVGIYLESEEDRVYPIGDVARQIVGRVDPDENGVTGIEQQYDEVLDGSPGSEKFEGGRYGRISVGDSVVDPATEGFDVILTLDNRLQFMAEQTLIEHCEKTGAKSATAVMTDVTTAEILVMASVDRNDDDECEVAGYNTALVDTFEPGSVLKPITIAGAVQELGYDRNTPIEVPPSITIANKRFVDHPEHPAAMYPLSQVLADSSNVGTIKVSQALGPELSYRYLTNFGFSRGSGLGFAGESVGTLRSPSDWQGSDAGSIPIGQGITVNATQIASAYSTFGNGGSFREPLLISALRDADGETFSPDERPTRTVLSRDASQEALSMLEQVVVNGTGKRAAIPGYRVAGKTGTAWKVFDDGSGKPSYGEPGNRRYVVTFAGVAPVSNPRISLAVVVNEPADVVEATAGVVAAPIFSEIGGDAMRVLKVAPDGQASSPESGPVRGTPARAPEDPPPSTSPDSSTSTSSPDPDAEPNVEEPPASDDSEPTTPAPATSRGDDPGSEAPVETDERRAETG